MVRFVFGGGIDDSHVEPQYTYVDQMVNSIGLIWKLVCMLRIYRTWNLTVRFSNYEFKNKLLDDIKLLKIALGVTWLYIYINFMPIKYMNLTSLKFENYSMAPKHATNLPQAILH